MFVFSIADSLTLASCAPELHATGIDLRTSRPRMGWNDLAPLGTCHLHLHFCTPDSTASAVAPSHDTSYTRITSRHLTAITYPGRG